MRLDSNCISRATQMKLIMQFGVGLDGNCQFVALYWYCWDFGMHVLEREYFYQWNWYLPKNLCLKGIDIDAATRCGIKVARIPGHNTGNAASCAEMAIYFILGLLRKQVNLFNLVKGKKLKFTLCFLCGCACQVQYESNMWSNTDFRCWTF